LVGPPAISSPGSTGDAVDAVTVVSWNVQMGHGDVLRFVQDMRLGRLAGVAASDDFVLLLQEVYRAGSEVPAAGPPPLDLPRVLALPRDAEGRDIRALASALGASLVYVPSMRNGRDRVDRGNAIVSSLPLTELFAVELPFERQRRVAVGGVVEGRSSANVAWRLAMITAHLDTAPALLRGGPAAARERQASALLEVIARDPAPVFLGGDFNTSWGDDEPAVRSLRRALPDAVPAARGATWRGPLAMEARLDHVFARLPPRDPRARRSPVVVHRARERYGSDHHPLVAVVRPAD
jgi:endonuclease/exonuclease/phosphatase family metal-dependent hydrolase